MTRFRAMELSVILSIVAALGVGGWIGSVINNWMTIRRETAARAVQFRKQQLEQFYGPLLAMHKEIRARSELRVKLQEAIDAQHMEDMLHAGPGKTEEASDARLPAILTNIWDENETFRNVLMPRYHEMIDVFRDKMWLAEPETREYFKNLIEFVDDPGRQTEALEGPVHILIKICCNARSRGPGSAGRGRTEGEGGRFFRRSPASLAAPRASPSRQRPPPLTTKHP
jgi:hypothetical protein